MLAVGLVDLLGLLGIVAFCGGMYFLASRIEPHWVSKDRTRFLSVAQELDQWGLPAGRRREVRVRIDGDSDSLVVSRRSMLRPDPGTWIVNSRDPQPERKRAVYQLKRVGTSDQGVSRMALRVPLTSKILTRLDELLEVTGEEAVLRRERDRRRAARAPPTGASDTPESRRSDPPADPG